MALNDSDVHFDVVGAEQVEGTAASHTADHRSSRSRVDGESAKAEGGLHGDEQISQRGTELCRRVLASIRRIWQRAIRAAASQCMFMFTSVQVFVMCIFYGLSSHDSVDL